MDCAMYVLCREIKNADSAANMRLCLAYAKIRVSHDATHLVKALHVKAYKPVRVKKRISCLMRT